jgi:hypothetical protein
MMTTLMIAAAFFLASLDQATCSQHEQHTHAVDARHDTFGMAHDVSAHHFRLFRDGGAIELRADDPHDAATVSAIRKHLRKVAAAFTKNDFSTPVFVHGRPPDGVDTMKRLRDRIRYRYESVDAGGRIRVTTSDQVALAAIHDFLKFQIAEHRTGDSGQIEENR